MRIALLADIHGNLAALQAVLADIQATGGADTILVLGDIAMLGPQPAEVIATLRQAGCVAIQGNTDAWYNEAFAQVHLNTHQANHCYWARPYLGEENIRYLLDLPFSWEGDFSDGERLLAVHGSPRRIDEPIHPEADKDELDEILAGVRASVVACGHTHRAMVRRHRDIILINPGTVGNPIPPELDPRATYALLTCQKGRLEVSLRRVAYNPEPTLAVALERQMPGATQWVAKFRRMERGMI